MKKIKLRVEKEFIIPDIMVGDIINCDAIGCSGIDCDTCLFNKDNFKLFIDHVKEKMTNGN